MLEQCVNLFGSMPELAFTIGTRTWSSSVISYKAPIHALAFGDNGGADIMRALGEENILSKTTGHQRPALYSKIRHLSKR